MSEKSPVVAVRVSPEIHARLEALAQADRRSVSQIVRFMIEDALKASGKSRAASSSR